MLGSRIRAAREFQSCQPMPSPMTAGWMTDRPPFSAVQVIPSSLVARWTPSSPLRVKYENRKAFEPGCGLRVTGLPGTDVDCPPAPDAAIATANQPTRQPANPFFILAG